MTLRGCKPCNTAGFFLRFGKTCCHRLQGDNLVQADGSTRCNMLEHCHLSNTRR